MSGYIMTMKPPQMKSCTDIMLARLLKRSELKNSYLVVHESDVTFMNLYNENNESRKKVGQKLAFWKIENPEPVEK